ncbi:Uncharacterised protein [Mycobacterium tuberculosis]|nr:Uncharacterised protein [Mycobacterium tuberculosis]
MPQDPTIYNDLRVIDNIRYLPGSRWRVRWSAGLIC